MGKLRAAQEPAITDSEGQRFPIHEFYFRRRKACYRSRESGVRKNVMWHTLFAETGI